MSGDFSFLKGNINTIILCALYDKDGKGGGKYGYEIAKEIKDRTDGKYEIKQPTLYAYLKKLEQQDLIESYWGTESNGGRRRYYKLTPKGRHDCEQFMAEWEYHKTVLSTLVDTTETNIEVTQSDVTPLFGERQKKVKPSEEHVREMNEQDELARKLDALWENNSAQTEAQNTVEAAETPQDEQFDLSRPSQQQDMFAAIDESTVVTENENEYEADTTVQENQEAAEESEAVTEEALSEENELSKFDVKQDSADDFMQQFDERAREISERDSTTAESSENYQHVLMNVVGEQLDDMRQFENDEQDGAQKYYTDHPVALEEVADQLAQKGVRMRIYNHSATFKSKKLMPNNSVMCKTAWLTFAVAAIYFMVLTLTSITNNNWQPFLVTLAIVALVPIAFTVYALYEPGRKEKPSFHFNRILIASATLAAIIILFALGISIFTRIELNDYAAVSTRILIPTGIAILFPVFVVVYNYYYKKY